ncbi:hypothetical protein [Candidatus Amarobacter glycogenicus]|uniref:hypothetical protein n=1 Tax=Candidatus Amarobacter glycogenicus TaxID=3140699 RepID=UPI0031371BEB|nr:hypothetical protein [Dehalococcoidia bacterium]
MRAYVLSGASYGTSTQVGSYQCNSCNTWQTMYVDIQPFRGQSIKVKFDRGTGSQVSGVDNLRTQIPFPGWEVVGTISRQTEDGGNVFIGLEGGASPAMTSSEFTVDSTAQYMTVKVKGISTNSDSYYIDVLSGASYGTATQVAFGNVGDSVWETARWNVSAAGTVDQGQGAARAATRSALTILAVRPSTRSTGTSLRRHAPRNGRGATGDYVSTDGNLVSQPFTIPSGTQHISVKVKDPGATRSSYVELLRGPSYGTVTTLGGGPGVPDQPAADLQVWRPDPRWRDGQDSCAPVLPPRRLRRYRPDGPVLPGWSLTTDGAVTTGADAYGTYVSGFDTSAYLKSSLISQGIVDVSGAQQKFFAATYQQMNGGTLKVTWYNTSGSSWVVLTKNAAGASGIQTAYFGTADFMGQTGYFLVQVSNTVRFYSIADNIARQQLQEPMSHKVGIGIDSFSSGLSPASPTRTFS